MCAEDTKAEQGIMLSLSRYTFTEVDPDREKRTLWSTTNLLRFGRGSCQTNEEQSVCLSPQQPVDYSSARVDLLLASTLRVLYHIRKFPAPQPQHGNYTTPTPSPPPFYFIRHQLIVRVDGCTCRSSALLDGPSCCLFALGFCCCCWLNWR